MAMAMGMAMDMVMAMVIVMVVINGIIKVNGIITKDGTIIIIMEIVTTMTNNGKMITVITFTMMAILGNIEHINYELCHY